MKNAEKIEQFCKFLVDFWDLIKNTTCSAFIFVEFSDLFSEIKQNEENVSTRKLNLENKLILRKSRKNTMNLEKSWKILIKLKNFENLWKS